jgi:hypothetical protein
MSVTVDVRLGPGVSLQIETAVHRTMDALPGDWAVVVLPIAAVGGGVAWVVEISAADHITVTALVPGEQDVGTFEARLVEVVKRRIAAHRI